MRLWTAKTARLIICYQEGINDWKPLKNCSDINWNIMKWNNNPFMKEEQAIFLPTMGWKRITRYKSQNISYHHNNLFLSSLDILLLQKMWKVELSSQTKLSLQGIKEVCIKPKKTWGMQALKSELARNLWVFVLPTNRFNSVKHWQFDIWGWLFWGRKKEKGLTFRNISTPIFLLLYWYIMYNLCNRSGRTYNFF